MKSDYKKIRALIRAKIIQELRSDYHVKSLSNLDSQYIRLIKPNGITDDDYWKDCVYYLIHTILGKTVEEDFKSGSKYVALQYDVLKKVLGPETTIIIKTLIKDRVIERDNKYAKGETSFGYKIHPKFRAKGYPVNKTLTHATVLRRFRAFRQEYFRSAMEHLYKYWYLVKWLTESKLTFHNGLAQEFVSLMKQYLFKYFTTYYKNLSISEVTNMINWANFGSMRSSAEEIISINELPRIGLHGLRLYSSITGMYSPLRNFLLYNNLPLVYIDISNSQPFHFLVLLQSDFWKPSKKKSTLCLKNLNKELYEYLNRNKQSRTRVEHTIMTLEQYEKQRETGFKGSKNVVFRKSIPYPTFSYLAMNGKLYKFIQKKFSNKFINNQVDPFGDDKAAKQSVIKMFYANDKNKITKNYKHFSHFKTLFPVEAEIIEILKLRSYKDFSVMLQRIEAQLVLENVCGHLNAQNPSMPLFTIHDGIITTVEHEGQVKQALESVYKRELGVVPEYKVEYLKPSSLNIKEEFEKKTKKITESNELPWVKPKADMMLFVDLNFNMFREKVKEIKENPWDDLGVSPDSIQVP